MSGLSPEDSYKQLQTIFTFAVEAGEFPNTGNKQYTGAIDRGHGKKLARLFRKVAKQLKGR